MARNLEPVTLNPYKQTENGSIYVNVQIFDQLVEQAPGTKEPAPGLAQSWDISPDGLSYTFHLREAKFSNGDPVTAEDVKYSLDKTIGGLFAYFLASIKEVVVVDPSTVRLDMKHPDASVLSTLTIVTASIVPEKVYEQLGDDKFGETPVGTGPFMLKTWNRGQNIELVRNPNYWQAGKPYLDGVNFVYVADDNSRMLKIQTGEAQIAQAVPVTQIDRLNQLPGVKVLVEPTYATFSVWLNLLSKPLDDKLVRQALNYATPKDVINKVVFGGTGVVQNSMIAATEFWDPSVPAYTYDIDKAKQLMAQSSVPSGFTLPLTLVAGNTQTDQTAQILKTEWAKIGVTLDIQPVDIGVRSQKQTDTTFVALLFGPNEVSSDTPDDSEMCTVMIDYNPDFKSYFTSYNSTQVSQLCHDAVATVDPTKRQTIYAQIQRLALDDAPQVAMIFVPALTAVSDKVHNFSTLPSGWWTLQDVWLTP